MNCLGYVAGLLVQHMRKIDHMHEDLQAFHAPSECYGDVNRGLERDRIVLFAQIEETTGYTPKELFDELVSRCSSKFLFDYGLTSLVHDEIVYRETMEWVRNSRKQQQAARIPLGMSGASIGLQQQRLQKMEEQRLARRALIAA